ncbi:hypothetical protein [Sediminibacter sp. Hel_I_10]|uniref:hypothetical protein n=1 Tax=Sediminibacter sp. Hel_I_10 TaxID=1392490 RepID=UPI00047D5A23|nr:hypothetical protein [Sediminibacter sp. Hel_I_10]
MTRIFTITFILVSFFSFAQGHPSVEDTSLKTEEVADNITDQYDQKLAMTYKQKELFKKKVEDFLILRKKIMDNNEGEAELNALVNLQAEETLAMNDVLTRIQMDLYKDIKPTIQPLKVVEKEKK